MRKATQNELTIFDINQYAVAIDKKINEMMRGIVQNKKGLQNIEEEYPLLPPEADDLSNAVRRKGVQILGGKKSNAYQNKEIRRKVYRDIYYEIKRQYGLINENGSQKSYKKLQRKNLNGAFDVVENYLPPVDIENEITAENEIDFE